MFQWKADSQLTIRLSGRFSRRNGRRARYAWDAMWGWGWIYLSEWNAVKAAKNPLEKEASWGLRGWGVRGEIKTAWGGGFLDFRMDLFSSAGVHLWAALIPKNMFSCSLCQNCKNLWQLVIKSKIVLGRHRINVVWSCPSIKCQPILSFEANSQHSVLPTQKVPSLFDFCSATPSAKCQSSWRK